MSAAAADGSSSSGDGSVSSQGKQRWRWMERQLRGGAASETSCVCLWQVVVVVIIVNVVASYCPQVFFSQHSQLLQACLFFSFLYPGPGQVLLSGGDSSSGIGRQRPLGMAAAHSDNDDIT